MLAAALIFVMHEQMHQRTGEKQQPGQPGQHKPKMRPVFGEEIKSAENTKTHENDVSAGGEEAALPAFVTTMIHHGLHNRCPSH